MTHSNPYDSRSRPTCDDRGTEADVYYTRIRQADGGMARAGPLWVESV